MIFEVQKTRYTLNSEKSIRIVILITEFHMNKYSHLLPSVKPKSYIQEQMKTLQEGGIPDGLRTGIKELD